MKKLLLLLASVALLIVGCAKDQLSSNGAGDGMTKVTFTASLDSGVATKAAVDGDGAAASVNRCIMEIYYGDALFTRQITKVTDKKATFPVQVVSNRTYTVAFWADKVDNADTPEGLAADKYYNTASLKEIALNGAYSGNDDARDAFFHVGNYTVAQAGSSFGSEEDKILLKRPFAQMNVITTDWDIVSAPVAALAPEQVNVIIKNPLVKFNAVTGEASADANTPTLSYTADVYVAPASTGTAPANEKTLSMDYLFASTTKEFIDIDWKALHGTDTPVAHAFAAVPYQRNYRTNIKGKLLTTTGQWTVTVDPDWTTPEYDVPFLSASTIAEAQSYIAPGTQGSQTSKVVDLSKATITTEDFPGEDKKIEFRLKTTSPADMVNFTLPAIPAEVISAGCTGWKITCDEGYPTDNVNVTAPTGTNIIIQAPTSHVVLNGQTYGNIDAHTGYGTLVVPQGVTINNLTVTKGLVEIHGTVNTLNPIVPAAGESVYFRDCEGLSQTVFAKIKGEGFNFIHPDYVEKQNGDKWDIIPVAIPVTGVSLNLDKVALNVGEDTSLTATVLPEDASNTSVVWTSSNKAVAIVDHAGKVTAVAAGSATITVTTVNKSKTATCSVTVIPAEALGGEFSVSNDGGTTIKQVYFSQGNLTYNVSTTTWAFYEHQYDCATGYDPNLISLFTWGYNAKMSIVPNETAYYNVSTSSGNLKQTEDWGCTIGDGNTWRTLSSAEWTYLFNNTGRMVNSKPCYSNAVSGVSIGGTTYKGVFIYPDNYNGDVVSSSMTWDQINAAGIVFLPAAGRRHSSGSRVDNVGDNGNYWSSTASNEYSAYFVNFSSSKVSPNGHATRDFGHSVRLITECQ